jgi:hypothetical protein
MEQLSVFRDARIRPEAFLIVPSARARAASFSRRMGRAILRAIAMHARTATIRIPAMSAMTIR